MSSLRSSQLPSVKVRVLRRSNLRKRAKSEVPIRRSEYSNLCRARTAQGRYHYMLGVYRLLLIHRTFTCQYEPREGLLPTLLQLISPQAVSSSAVVRLAAAIYLKNRVNTSWRAPSPPSPHTHYVRTTPYTAIPPSDRLALKLNILPLLAALAQDPTGVPVKQQMEVVLAKVIEADYPENWPGLGDEVMALLSKGEGEVDAGLRAIVLVIRNLR